MTWERTFTVGEQNVLSSVIDGDQLGLSEGIVGLRPQGLAKISEA